MLKILHRIENLEEAILPPEDAIQHVFVIDYVDQDGVVVGTKRIEPPVIPPHERLPRARRKRGRW